MISDLDIELNNFIAKYITSLVSWDLLHYCYQNPESGYTPNFLSGCLNHDLAEVKDVLEAFADRGEFRLVNGKYYYQPTKKFKKYLDALVKMMENPETRRLILVNILKCSSNSRII